MWIESIQHDSDHSSHMVPLIQHGIPAPSIQHKVKIHHYMLLVHQPLVWKPFISTLDVVLDVFDCLLAGSEVEVIGQARPSGETKQKCYGFKCDSSRKC